MSDDDLEPLVTECPHCSTRFRVTEAQLQVATGRVRCGACLTVFQGVDRLLWEKQPELPEGQAGEMLDELLDELNDPADEPTEVGVEDSKLDSNPDAGIDEKAQKYQQIFEVFPAEEPGGVPAEAELNDSGLNDADPGAQTEAEAGEEAETEAETEGGDVDVDNSAVEADEQVREPAAEVVSASVPSENIAQQAESADAHVYGLVPIDNPSLQLAADEISDARAPGEPVSFAIERRTRWWVPPAMLLAIAALVGQVMYLQFDSWTKDLGIRPVYEKACELIGCELPVLRDVDQLVVKNLVVRSHPEVAGALIVDAIIVNEAPFAQPFPVLVLRFTSLEGNLVAGGNFQPDQYLAGELEGAEQIQRMTPVHIELEFEDPGSEAVNYFLDFR
ncbi:MAG: DUF3426 domain-containing protein [Gammaproteobacteria bacterium]|nr:DUF3426 domain-containing protein [Gammaproteobacteria bacterium]